MAGQAKWELLQLMLQHDFTTLITIDNNLSYQQNFKNYPIQVISLVSFDNTYGTIMDFFDTVIDTINQDFIGLRVVIHPNYKV